MLTDAWRLAVGTLTTVPVAAPAVVDRRRAGAAMLLAPLAVVPLGAAVATVAMAGHVLGLSALVTAVLCVACLALGTRVLHLDGLADVTDGLTASYDKERSLAVMKSGSSGPAGVVAVVVVLALQVSALASIFGLLIWWRAAILAGVAVCASRGVLVICCARRVQPARQDGLGSAFTQSVAPGAAMALWVLITALLAAVGGWAGADGRLGLAAAVAAVLVTVVVVRHATGRFGGVTGDVFGACIELALASILIVLSSGVFA
ncbi:MAG: adenosylcobinamide-GDP ribazoletransferase [Aeromicrobium sp.]|uniref:adenosylcobinamide-GDP ribazoletransferase n=1 Tax=Aeromicrobium sp. TaxID=1871063 RepID=UPI0039E2391A